MPDHNANNSDRPSVCRNCGALIGAGENSCHVCGAPLIQPAAASLPLPERYAVSYARAVLSRPYIFTIAFLVANLFVFLLMWQSSGLSMSSLVSPFSEGVLLDYGAKKNYFIFFEHQYWRFVTPMFVHVHVLHLLVNMYGLWIIGPWVEKLYGSAKFVVLWVATGVAGVVVSYLTVIPGPPRGLIASFLIRTTDNPSAGASGALFGMIGVLFVFGIKYRRELPDGFKRAFGAGMLPVIMLNLGIGFLARDFVDNGAHLGGLLSGAALAGVIGYKRPGASTPVTIAWRVLQVAALLLVLVCFGMAVRAAQRQPRPSPKQVQAAREAEYQTFYANNNAFRSGEAAAISALENGDLSGLPPAAAALEKTAHLNNETDALRTELKLLLGRAEKYVNDWHQPGWKMTIAFAREKQQLIDDFKLWQGHYETWYWAEAKKFGIEHPTPTPAG